MFGSATPKTYFDEVDHYSFSNVTINARIESIKVRSKAQKGKVMNRENLKKFKEDLGGKDMHKHEEKTTTIIVNGVRRETREKRLSFEEIIKLAFGQYDPADNVAYTVTYSYKKGHHNDKGILVVGDLVKVKEGMVLNVTKTTRS